MLSKLFVTPEGKLAVNQYCYTRRAMCMFEIIGSKGIDFIYKFIQRLGDY